MVSSIHDTLLVSSILDIPGKALCGLRMRVRAMVAAGEDVQLDGQPDEKPASDAATSTDTGTQTEVSAKPVV